MELHPDWCKTSTIFIGKKIDFWRCRREILAKKTNGWFYTPNETRNQTLQLLLFWSPMPMVLNVGENSGIRKSWRLIGYFTYGVFLTRTLS
jgi:hypothetical protein